MILNRINDKLDLINSQITEFGFLAMYQKIIHLILSGSGNCLIESISSVEKTRLALDLFSAMSAEKKIRPDYLFFVTGKPSGMNHKKNVFADNILFNKFAPRVLSIQDLALELLRKNIIFKEIKKHQMDTYRYPDSKKFIIAQITEKISNKYNLNVTKSLINNISSSISFLRNNLINASELDKIGEFEWLADIIKEYNSIVSSAKLFYNEDILDRAVSILSGNNVSMPVCECLIADDFQNLNKLEYEFLKKYFYETKKYNPNCRIVISANPFYTLTQYRGSCVSFIKKAVTDFDISDANRFRLALMPNVPGKIQDVLKYISVNQPDKTLINSQSDLFAEDLGEIICVQVTRETDEPFFIVEQIRKHIRNGGSLNDIGICYYRIKDEARYCYDVLTYNNIPCEIASGLSIREAVSFKFIENCVLFVANISDDRILRKILNAHVLGLNPVDVSKILHEGKMHNLPLYLAILRFADRIADRHSRERLYRLLIYLKNCSVQANLKSVLRDVCELAGLFEYVMNKPFEIAAIKNVFQSLEFFHDFFYSIKHREPAVSDYNEFLNYFLQDNIREINEKKEDCVRIASIFDCDSFNFKTVFIPSMTAKYFPDQYIDFIPSLIKDLLKTKNSNYARYDRHILMEALSNAQQRCYLIYNRESGEPSPLFDQIKSIDCVKSIDSTAGFGNYKSNDYINDATGLRIWVQNRLYGLNENLRKETESEISRIYSDMEFVFKSLPDKTGKPVILARNFVFSASDIDAYLDCPRKFFWERIMKIETDDPERKDHQLFGQLIHSVLELFHYIYSDIGVSADSKHLSKEIITILRKKNAEFNQFSRLQRELNFFNAAECLNNYISILDCEKPIKIFSVERKIRFYLDDIPFSIKIDRIDNGSGTGIRIIDYKTSKSKKGEKALKNMFCSENPKSFQLPIYYLALKQVLLLDVKSMGNFYIQAKSEDGNSYCHKSVIPILNESDSKSVSYQELEEVKESIKNLSRRIMSGFYPDKGDSPNCYECGYKLICQ